ncbi:hypothetical protein IAU60_003503 [Kwoniella sp. DSM 27419]
MSSENILLNPLPELRAALASTSFGTASYTVLEDRSFPLTEEDLKTVRDESRKSGTTSVRVVACADVVLKKDEGQVRVRVDRRGWTVEQATGSQEVTSRQGRTYESLETLLIDVSRAYTEAMNDEIWKRFGVDKRDEGEWVDEAEG